MFELRWQSASIRAVEWNEAPRSGQMHSPSELMTDALNSSNQTNNRVSFLFVSFIATKFEFSTVQNSHFLWKLFELDLNTICCDECNQKAVNNSINCV